MHRLTFCLLVPWLLAASSLAELRLGFGDSAVTVSGATPGGQVAWVAASHERPRVHVSLVRREGILADDDGDGQVTIALGRPVPAHSVWVAIDLATGQVASGAPPGRPDRRVAFPVAAGSPGLVGARTLSDRRELVAFLVARPGVGAWVRTCGEGADGDSDGSPDGSLTVAVAGLLPVGASGSAPQTLEPADVVVGLDLESLEYYVGRPGRPE